MTETQHKALALVNAAFLEPYYESWAAVPQGCVSQALIRAIEQHDAFRKEVSDAVVAFMVDKPGLSGAGITRFIIAKPVDPLVEALRAEWPITFQDGAEEHAEALRAALAAHNLEIRDKSS